MAASPNDVNSFLMLARIKLARGDFEGALQDLDGGGGNEPGTRLDIYTQIGDFIKI